MDRAFVNTVLGFGSTAATFIVSKMVKKGKFDMVHVQNATLAGVAVGASRFIFTSSGCNWCWCNSWYFIRMRYDYLSDILNDKFKIADTCGY